MNPMQVKSFAETITEAYQHSTPTLLFIFQLQWLDLVQVGLALKLLMKLSVCMAECAPAYSSVLDLNWSVSISATFLQFHIDTSKSSMPVYTYHNILINVYMINS